MNNWQYADKLPTSPWRGQMTLARRLTLLRDKTGFALSEDPVLAGARTGTPRTIAATLTSAVPQAELLRSDSPLELKLTIQPSQSEQFGLRVYSDDTHWTEIVFDRTAHRFSVDRTKSGAEVGPGFATRTDAPLQEDRPWDLHLVFDRSSVSAFAQDGTIAMTNLVFPPSTHLRVVTFSQDKQQLRMQGQVWTLKSIW